MNVGGRGPESRFSRKSSDCREGMLDTHGGSVPVRPFPARQRSIRQSIVGACCHSAAAAFKLITL